MQSHLEFGGFFALGADLVPVLAGTGTEPLTLSVTLCNLLCIDI